MSMRRLAAPGTRGILNCLHCGRSLGKGIGRRSRIRCSHCQTVHIVSQTLGGNIVLTDEKYADRFRWDKEDQNDEEVQVL